ncbi:MAG: BMP family protein [Haloarculaceae archaeon]
MDPERRRLLRALGAAGLGGLAGCTGGPTESTPTEEPTETSTPTPSGGSDGGDGSDGGMDGTPTETSTPTATPVDPTYIGMVYATGGLGDGSFNDQAQQGLFDADEDFSIEYRESQPEEASQFSTFQRQYAESSDPDYDLVCCIGFLQTDALATTSENYPDQNFMLVDSVVDAPNVASYTFKEHEGSYLVGQVAGMLTTRDFEAGAGSTAGDSTNVGFVGGVESDLIGKFEAGFTAGVKTADEDVDVITNYVGDFSDPTGGREAALAMYDSGADVVYHAAGNTGTGVFRAAQDRGRFAIGVDRDQSVTLPDFQDVILASMVKRVDTAVYDAVESVVNDSFQGGSVVSLGLAEEGVGAVYGQQLGSEIPEDVKTAVSDARQGIIDGDISVPTDPGNV